MIKDFRNFCKDKNVSMSSLDDIAKRTSLPMGYQNPSILEEREMHVTQMDVFSRLMMERIIYFGSEVTSETCSIVVAQLLYLDSISKDPITMYINSPGGEVLSGYGVIGAMANITSNGGVVATVNSGMAASMGAMFLMSGTRGHRSSLQLARTMIHQPLGGVSGQATEILIEAEEIKKTRKELYDIIQLRTGQPLKKIEKDAERNYWMNGDEAKAYGIVDKVIPLVWND